VIRSIAADGRPDLGGVFRPIDRPRVLERIAMAAQYRIATIIAPAGFGKSVAVRQFLTTVPSSVVYDVPSDATTLLPFVRGFADALEDALPSMRRSLPTALEGTRNSKAPGRDLGAWAATHLRTLDTLVVIDDLHVGEGDPEISRFVTTLLERTKPGPRWLLSSRSPLQLPVASWLAYGESDLVVDAVDLRFDRVEAKQSARASRLSIRDEELDGILDLVDGWPAALTFALRTSTRASDLRAVSVGTRDMVYRYLAEQVWHSLDDRVRDFLRTVAFLPRLETRLAVAAGFDDAAAIIEELRERVAFITALDPGVYKLHDLFRDFVQRQIQLEGDDALRASRIAAATVLETVGMHGAALERYVAASAHTEIERLLTSANFALLESGHYDVVERALRVLPSGAVQTRAAVLALRAAIEDAHGRTEQAERWYANVLEQPLDDVSFRISVAWRYALMLFQHGRPDMLPMLRELRDRDDLCSADRAQILGMLALTLALAGEVAEARSVIDEALRLAEFLDDELRARTFGRAATVAFFAKDEEAVEGYTREGSRLAVDCGAFSLAARFFSTLTSLHGAAGRIPTAAWYASQVAANAEKSGNPKERAYGLRALLEYEAERGNADRIVEIERELNMLSYRGNAALSSLISGRAIAATWDGRFGDAVRELQSATERELAPFQQLSRLAMVAAIAAGGGDRRTALEALTAYDTTLENEPGTLYGRDRAYCERYLLLANLVLGRNALAQRALRALTPAEELEPFDAALSALMNRAPEAFEAALRKMRVNGIAGIARMLEAIAAPLLTEVEKTPVPLTAVELQVLAAMARGWSNQAIADEQRRTINTVRTHVSSILRKLGCESRGEAVAIARRRELV
jgi:LuxR family transcriptional regulator, maltose regulon positive regulatory protein